MRYVVSFGPIKNRTVVSFLSYKNALRFMYECIDADRFRVCFDSFNDEMLKGDFILGENLEE